MVMNFDSGTFAISSADIAGDGFTSPSRTLKATGSGALIDGIGLEWFANTNITFATTSSASAAMSEASFTQSVNATTIGGGTVVTTLNDAFDGYNSLLVNGTPIDLANYNQLGAAPTTEDAGRELVFPVKTFGTVDVSRKVFVPTNDSFARWLNIFTNTGATPQNVTVDLQNNLGSDNNTVIVTSSDGNATASLTDNFVTTFQNYSGTTSSDVRLGHVLQGSGAPTPLSRISFTNGDDNPTWGYNLTLAPGQTAIIMNFATGQASNAAAATKSAELTGLPSNALQGMSAAEISQVVNFLVAPPATPGTTVIPSGGGNLILGNNLANVIFGTAVNDTMYGYAGNDYIAGQNGADYIDGGIGNDSLFGGEGNDSLLGGADNDILFGGAGNDSLLGGAGNDSLLGEAGNDTLTGGAGADTLTGGADIDAFVYNAIAEGGDTISDFAVTEKFLISRGGFGGGLLLGTLTVNQFTSGAGLTAATNATQRFIYDTTSGTLRFDADGNGIGASSIVATLTTLPALSNSNIQVF